MKPLDKEVNIFGFIQKNALFLLIFFLGSIFRIWSYWDWSFTNDELSALNRLNFAQFSDLIKFGVKIDGHPAFVQVLLFYWSKLFGVSELSIRFPFIIAGIGSIIYLYKLAKIWLGYQRAIFSSVLFSFSQLFILYSQIARPYSMGVLFVLGFAFYWTCLINSKKRSIKTTLLFILFGILALLTHYFAGLTIATLMFVGLSKLSPKKLIHYIGACIAIALLFLPHLPITLHHISIGGVGWLPEPEWNFIYLFFYQLLNNKLSFLFTALAFFSIGVFFKGLKIFNRQTLLFFSLFFIPYFISYFYSIHKSPLLQFSVLLFFAPFLILGISSLLPSVINKRPLYILLSLTSFLLISQYSFFSSKPFANYKAVIQECIELESKLGKGRLSSIGNFTDETYAQYYIDRLSPEFAFDYININSKKRLLFCKELESQRSEYIMVAYANSAFPHEVHELIKHYYPTIFHKTRFFNSEVIVYSKKANNRSTYFKTEAKAENHKWSINQKLIQDTVFRSSPNAYSIKANTSYALTYKDSVYNLFKDNKYLTSSCSFKSEDSTDISIVTVVKRNGETIFWNAQALKQNWTGNNWSFACSVLERVDTYKPNDEVYVYLWNPKKEVTFIDDFKITNYSDSDYNYYEF